jgi:hypothetical protein
MIKITNKALVRYISLRTCEFYPMLKKTLRDEPNDWIVESL